ncbi:hypothetical protein E4T66_02340 [Sinimarinibacterium sp. CAU 1509]|uniref:hypothetical protein n=1 Tax=Sinimarinibacterium sp. CAU 1509 TaxID=2562283 RepID=UPI0010AD6334|nr:hypothetical protein [Sinimarinibacterium sp. CAU 1509]TJY65083.1 hypothetical protein E4T66_02340 [Sinimarinibacterium sp. CAU 1509]
MQIKIEIDVRPDELRRFLGLPDVAGLQDDVVAFLRDKIGAAGEFDAGDFVKHNVETLRSNPTWQKLVGKLRIVEAVDEVAAAAMAATSAPKAAPGKARARKTAKTSRRRAKKTAE